MGGKPKIKEDQPNLTNDPQPIVIDQQPHKNLSTQAPSQQNQQRQAPKLDFGSLMNSMMSNPALMQMAENIASGMKGGKNNTGERQTQNQPTSSQGQIQPQAEESKKISVKNDII